MDEYSRSRKASTSGVILSKKGPGLSLRDASNNSSSRETATVPVCSRVGCGSRMSSLNTISSLNKAKSAKHPAQPSINGKRVVAGGSSSSRLPSSPSSSTRKSVLGCQRKSTSSQPHTVLETQNLQDRSILSSQSVSTAPKSSQSRFKPPQSQVSGQFFYREINNSSSSSTPHSRNGKKASTARELTEHSASPSTSAASRTGSYAAARNGASTSRNIFRKCNSTRGDPGPSGCASPSSSLSSHSERKEVVGRKRCNEAESSSCSVKGKRMSGGGTISDDKTVKASYRGVGGGISISDSRRSRNLASSGRDSNDDHSAALVRTNRSTIARTNRSIEQENNRHRLVRRTESSSILGRRLTVPDNDNDMSLTGSEYQSSTASSSGLTATIESMLGDGTGTTAPVEIGGFGGRLTTNRENLRLYNLDGITEMLLALERIEQNEELSYEQLLALESNLFLGGGLSFHDQHRDMRLDIDNMSYEELLALEEKIGTVSTALTEEDLERCVKKGIFQGSSSDLVEAAAASEGRTETGEADDFKCCICQEEYLLGDKVGRLGCEHRYHVECINQWLRLKNWCPICKVEVLQHSQQSPAAEPAPSSSQLLL